VRNVVADLWRVVDEHRVAVRTWDGASFIYLVTGNGQAEVKQAKERVDEVTRKLNGIVREYLATLDP
jgi:hypothetical protein